MSRKNPRRSPGTAGPRAGSRDPRTPARRSPSPALRSDWLWAGLLAAATLAVHAGLARCDFVNYDDFTSVVRNPYVSGGLTPAGIRWAFTTIHSANWHPLTWLSHMLIFELFGAAPMAHHMANILLHAASAALLLLILDRMTGALWPSAFVAAVFAFHPLHVESVAWIAERKGVLSGLFWMLTLAAWLSYIRQPSRIRYTLVLASLACGLMAKPMLVTLPFVLLLLDVWPLRRPLSGRLLLEKAPLLGLSALFSLVTFIVQRRGGTVQTLETFPLGLRVANALVSFVRYVLKYLWPADLVVFYPYDTDIPLWKPLASLLFLAGVSALALLSIRRRPFLAVGWFWFLGVLVPVVGFVQVSTQSMADRYAYLPAIGLSMMLAWGLSSVPDGGRWRRPVLATGAGLALAALAATSWAQAGHWKDSKTLWRHALAVFPDHALARFGLASALREEGAAEQAAAEYEEAIRLDPTLARAHVGLAMIRQEEGRLEEAIAAYREAARLDPAGSGSATLARLARTLEASGRSEEAAATWEEVLRREPQFPGAAYDLGVILFHMGRFPEAVERFTEAVRLQPASPEAHNNLGLSLLQTGRTLEALEHFRQAVRLEPGKLRTAGQLAWILATDPDAALRDGNEAAEIAARACSATGDREPFFLDILAAARAEQGRFEEAAATALRAADLAAASGKPRLAAAIGRRLEGYREGRPWRELPVPSATEAAPPPPP